MAKRPRSGHASPSMGDGREGGLRPARGAREAKRFPKPEGGPPAPSSPSPPQGGRGPTAPAPEGWVLLGEFGRAHGLKGEVRLKSSTADPFAITGYNPLRTGDGRSLTLTKVRPAPGAAPDILIALVQGVATRDAADALNRTQLFVERDRLPPPEDEDEFLLADLVGLAVERPDGTVLGRIIGVPNFGGGDLLEIAPVRRGPTGFLPFTKAFVPVVDLKGGRVVAEVPDDLFVPAKPEPDDPDAPTDGPARPKRPSGAGAPGSSPPRPRRKPGSDGGPPGDRT